MYFLIFSDVDVQIVDIEYTDDTPITRDLPRLHNFSVVIKNPSKIDIIPLENEYNFRLQYFLSSEAKPNTTAFLDSGNKSILHREMYEDGIPNLSASNFSLSIHFELNLTMCEALTSLCVAVSDVALASWKESDPANNVMCVNIEEHLTCHPGKDKLMSCLSVGSYLFRY